MGDDGHAPVGLLELVGQRYEFLSVLDATEYEKRELVDELGLSRSTVDRAVRELETADLVANTGSTYRVTLYGRVLLAIYDSAIEHIEQTVRAETLLARLPPDVEFDFGLLVDAEIVLAGDPTVRAPADYIAELFEDATQVQGLAYAHTSQQAFETIRRRVCDEGMSAEIVFRDGMLADLRQSRPRELRTVLETARFDAYAAPDVPFGLYVFESVDANQAKVCLAVYEPRRNLAGVIVNDNPEAIAWSREVFECYRMRADPVNPP